MVVAVSDPRHLQLHLPGLISRHAPAVAGAESVGYGWCETSEPHRQNHRQSQGPKWSNQGLVGLGDGFPQLSKQWVTTHEVAH